MPKLEGITVSVDYGDFLQECLPYNKKHFDYYIVITSPKDQHTQEICKKEGVDCLVTDAFYYGGTPFNKGLALSLGLQRLKHNEWVIIHDGDTCLPFDLRDKLKLEKYNKELMYGCSRKFIPTYKKWLECLKNKENFEKYESIPGFGVGFYQLFHRQASVLKNIHPNEIYPSYPTAEMTDIAFLYRWCPPPHPKPEKLDFDCYHLSNCHGAAHSGRKNSKINELKKPFKEMR